MAENPTGRALPMVQARDLTPDPVFERIGIVGLGLIGGSIALAARARWPRGLVIAVDRKDVLEQAMLRHAVDVAADDLSILAGADLVILAAPVLENVRLLAELPRHLAGPAIVTDVSSTKAAIVEAAHVLPAGLRFVGGHPMAGAAVGGFGHARPDLFQNRPWLLTPDATVPPEVVQQLSAFAEGLGSAVSTLTPSEHDRLLAALSHLPQLTVSALMAVVGAEAGEAGLALAGRGLVDTTRLASSPADVWRDIASTNAEQLGRVLDALIARLTHLRQGLDDGQALETTFEEAARWRAALMKDRTS